MIPKKIRELNPKTVLEIGPGYGALTQLISPLVNNLNTYNPLDFLI